MSIYSGDIRDQSRKLSEMALYFGRFFAIPNFRGRVFQKLYPCYHPCLPTRRLEKFCKDRPTHTGPELIGANTLNFKPNFKFSRLIFLGGAPSQLWCALASAGQSVSHVKIWGAAPPQGSKYSLPKNVRLGGSILAPIPYNSFACRPKFTQFLLSNVEGAVVDQILFEFAILWAVSGIFAIKVESCQKSRRILDVFFALPNFRGQAFQNLYRFYHLWLEAHHLEKVLWGYSH